MSNPQPHPKLNRIRKVFFAIAFLATFAAFATGIFAILNQRETLLQVLSFSLGFGSFIFTVITAFPKIINHTWDSRHALFYIIIAFIVIISLCLVPLAIIVFQEPVIKIGVSLPFGSSDRPDAIPMFNAINLAIHDGTDNGKIGRYTIQLVPFDDSKMDHQTIQPVWQDTGNLKGNTDDFTTITGDAQVAGIIGPFNSAAATYEIPPTSQASLALISPATTADCLTMLANFDGDNFDQCKFSGLDKNKEKNFFRMATPDSTRAEVLAGYLWQAKIGNAAENTAKEAAIFDDKSVFGRSFANRIQEAWKNKMNKHAPILDLTDNIQEALKVLNPKPDIILFSGTGSEAIALYKAMQDPTTGYSDTAFAAASTIMRGGLADASAKSDIYAVSPYSYFDESNRYNTFYSDYKNRYQSEPTPYSASAYDTTMILLNAIKEAVTYKSPPFITWDIFSQANQFRTETIKDIKEANNGGFQFTGVTGTYHFNQDGNAINYKGSQEATVYKHIPGTYNQWEHVLYTPEE